MKRFEDSRNCTTNREVYNTTLARRSIRSFTEKKVAREDVRTLLEAGMAAPSACDLQPWTFIVVDDEERLSETFAIPDEVRPVCILEIGYPACCK